MGVKEKRNKNRGRERERENEKERKSIDAGQYEWTTYNGTENSTFNWIEQMKHEFISHSSKETLTHGKEHLICINLCTGNKYTTLINFIHRIYVPVELV